MHIYRCLLIILPALMSVQLAACDLGMDTGQAVQHCCSELA
jgi:hypothetical protein